MRVGIIKDIFTHPKKALAEIDVKSERYFGPAIAVLIFVVISTIMTDFVGMWNETVYGETETELADYVSWIMASIMLGFWNVFVMLWVARKMYKIETTYKRIFSTLQFAILPFSISVIPIGIILGIYVTTITQQPSLELAYNILGIIHLVLLPFIIHTIILLILATKQSFQLSTLQVIAVWIVSMIITIIIIISIGIMLAILGIIGVGLFEI